MYYRNFKTFEKQMDGVWEQSDKDDIFTWGR